MQELHISTDEARRFLQTQRPGASAPTQPEPLSSELLTTALLLVETLLRSGYRDALQELLQARLAETSASPGHPRTSRPAAKLLSHREEEVLGLLGRGLSTKGIARILDLSPGTVKWHLKNIYGKLDAPSRERALAKARDLRILA